MIPWSSIRALFRSSWHFQETCRKHQSHQAKKWHEIADQICIKHFWKRCCTSFPASTGKAYSIFSNGPWPTQLLRNTHLHICHHLAMPGGSSFRSMGNVSRTRLWLPKGAHYAWGISKSFVLDQHIDIPIFSPQGGTHRPEDTLRLFSYVPSKKRNENILITIAFQGASPWLRNARSGSTSAGLVVKLRSSPANSSTSWEVIGWCKWHEKHRIYRSNLYIYIYQT